MKNIYHIGGDGRWDYATFDSDSQRLYVTRSTHTQGIDVSTGEVVVDIPGQQRSHGTAIATKARRGFISDGEAGEVVIFDLATGNVLGKISVASDADGIIYDSGTDRVLVGCGDAGKMAVFAPDIDLKNGKADLIDLNGSPEFLAADGTGKAFINIADKSLVAAIDLKTLTVTARWPIGTGEHPSGLAIDPQKHLLFVGCRNNKMIVMSSEDGHVVAELPIGRGVDACKFDPATGEAFASCGDGTLTVAK